MTEEEQAFEDWRKDSYDTIGENEPQVWRCEVCGSASLIEELVGHRCPRCGSANVQPALDGQWTLSC